MNPTADEGRHPPPPWFMRTGAAPEEGLLPVDVELAALTAGLRRLIKRQELPRDAAERACDKARAEGLAAGTVVDDPASGETATLFLGQAEEVVHEALRREPALSRRHRAKPFRDIRWMGAALGYPKCCVDRYIKCRTQDDFTLMRQLLPRIPTEPVSPYGLCVPPILGLISHSPCSVKCEATLRLGRGILDELDRSTPGYAKRWLDAARRVIILNPSGVAAMIRGSGPITDLLIDDIVSVGDVLTPAARQRWKPGRVIEDQPGQRLVWCARGWEVQPADGDPVEIAFVIDYRGDE